MKQNIFLKSVLRQPVRTALLATLMLIASFAFVARVAEYIVVNEEIDRIEGFYNAIGVLSPINPQDFTTGHDITQAAQVVADSPLVAFADVRNFAQGIMHESTNVITQFVGRDYFVPGAEGIDINTMEHYILATMVFP
ncbi:MAG: hypothetical protein FWC67_00250, partial [Defluviitaleaceae bacterium]|nr:hypothetical protein [Defluviitaleaceae bacterium]